MRIAHPDNHHIPQLRQLWQTAFGDPDDFLDSFFRTAYSCNRCRCVLDEDRIAAVLYWFDCALDSQKIAYIYAVATHPEFRNRGLCRALMEDTHGLLTDRGYAGVILVPQKESLRAMYAGMGYRDAGGLEELRCAAEAPAASLRAIGPEEYAALRRKFLPTGGVIQEQENLTFLSEQLQFYAGPDFLLAAYGEKETLFGVELLGSRAAAPGIVRALSFAWGRFRTPGTAIPFAMFHPLTHDCPVPGYFGFAFD